MNSTHAALEPTPRPDERGKARIDRLDSPDVAPGQYWRASADVPGAARVGDVLLVGDVRLDGVDDHRVDLFAHPRNGAQNRPWVQVLISDFYQRWTFAPDGAQIRAKEIEGLQSRTQAVQMEIARAQAEPGYLNERVQKALESNNTATAGTTALAVGGVGATQLLAGELPSINTYIEAGVTPQALMETRHLLDSAHALSKARSDWFNSRIQEISSITSAMLPYLQEAAQVPLSMVKRDIDRANDLLKSVQTMNLFVGDDVEVAQITAGEPAPLDAQISMFQSRLFLDEEMAYFSEYASNEVSFENNRDFVAAMKASPALLDLLVPAACGAVLVAFSRQNHWAQKDMHPITAGFLAAQDKRAWLLIRDGANAWLVGSPCDSHSTADLLFPELDLDGSVFAGVDGERISPESLRWTDRLGKLQSIAVHYRRFAVVLAGMVTRGIMWEGVDPMQFLSAGGAKMIRFVRDGSGEGVLGNETMTTQEWISRNQLSVRSGATVIVDLRAISHKDAPAFFRWQSARDGYCWKARLPDNPCRVHRVLRDGQQLYVREQLQHDWGKADIAGRVTLMSHGALGARDWLCADNIDPAELDKLLSSRRNRANYVRWFPLLHAARNMALAMREEAGSLAGWLEQQAVNAGLAAPDSIAAIVHDVVAQHRVGTAGEALPAARLPEAKPVLDLLYHRLKTAPEGQRLQGLEAHFNEQGITPLRVVMDAKGSLSVYTAPAEPDNRMARQIEVDHWKAKLQRSGWSFTPLAEKPLFVSGVDERTLHEWPAASDWAISGTPAHAKRDRLNYIEWIAAVAHRRRRILAGPWAPDTLERLLEEHYRLADPYVRAHGRMPDVNVSVPILLASTDKGYLRVLSLTENLSTVIGRNHCDPGVDAARLLAAAWHRVHSTDAFARRAAMYVRSENKAPQPSMPMAVLMWSKPKLSGDGDFLTVEPRRVQPPCYQLQHPYEGGAVGASAWLASEDVRANLASEWVWAPGWDPASSDPLIRWLTTTETTA